MSALAGLKLVAAKRPAQLSPVQMRRERLTAKLDEQIELVKAMLEGRQASFTRSRRLKNDATGDLETKQVAKRVRPCWWHTENGKVCFAVHYGGKELELAKGRSAIEVQDNEALPQALKAVRQAVCDGELDAQIASASVAVRNRMRQKK